MIFLIAACVVFGIMVAFAQAPLTDFSGYERDVHSVTVRAAGSAVRFMFYAPDIVRVDYLPTPSSSPDSSYAVVRRVDPRIGISLSETDSSLRIASSAVQILCRKFPLRIRIESAASGVILEEPPSGGLGIRGDSRITCFALRASEHFYGTGERGRSLDLRGSAFDTYNTQRGGYSTPPQTMNCNVPFLASSGGFGIYFDNVHRGHFDLGASDPTLFSYAIDGGEMTYYAIIRATVAGQLDAYTWLTGRQPLPPRWAFGYLQSKNRYANDSTATAIVRKLRTEQIPCDAIILDLAWFRHMGDLEWNREAWHDPESMMTEFLQQGIKTILITEPYVVETSSGFREGAEKGYLAKDSVGRPYLFDHWWSCGACRAGLVDMTNPAACSWWWGRHPSFLDDNVAGLWTDLGEPERHPQDVRHMSGSAEEIHNVYDFLWAQTLFEGMKEYRPGKRIFNLTRSGFAGIQRFGAIPWSGDVARTYGGLAGQIPLILNMGMSGLPYMHSDIGGYARNPTTPELYVRWMEFGTFSPIMRAHGAGETVGGSPTEPWRFGPQAEKICREFIRLRYRLLPYTYTLAHLNSVSGLPLARPVFFEDTTEGKAWVEDSSYFWGDAFLVAPVLSAGQTERPVYLPEGNWYDFWSDQILSGGRTVNATATLDRIPVFVRSGSIIPMGPVMEWTDERPLDTLTLDIYPAGDAPSTFTLYEDDGTTLAYQDGKFRETSFVESPWAEGKSTGFIVMIAASRGNYPGMCGERTYHMIIHGCNSPPAGVELGGVQLRGREEERNVAKSEGWYHYDQATLSLHVNIYCDTGSTYRITVTNGIQ